MRIDGLHNRELTPGYEEAVFPLTPAEQMTRARRYETQRGALTFPGPGLCITKRSALPEVVHKGCPHCGGDLGKEDANWGYGDYSCIACGRAWYVLLVTKAGLQFTPVSRIADEQPKREAKRR